MASDQSAKIVRRNVGGQHGRVPRDYRTEITSHAAFPTNVSRNDREDVFGNGEWVHAPGADIGSHVRGEPFHIRGERSD